MADIFQEVEEDIRRERYETLWKKYGNYVIVFAVIVVLSVAGQQAWQAYDMSRRQDFSERFANARQLAAANPAEAEAAFAALAADAPRGYASLARLGLADVMAEQGKEAEALAVLQEITEDSDASIAATARLRIAWTRADTTPRGELAALLAPLTDAENPWRFAAAEVLAYKELQSGNRAQAITEYDALAANEAAGATLRQRAGAIAQHLRANPDAGLPAPDAAAETITEEPVTGEASETVEAPQPAEEAP